MRVIRLDPERSLHMRKIADMITCSRLAAATCAQFLTTPVYGEGTPSVNRKSRTGFQLV